MTWTKMTWTKLSDPVSEYFDVLKLPSHVFPGPLIYALPLKLNLYFNLIEFEIDFHTSAPPKFRIFETFQISLIPKLSKISIS